VTSPYTHTGRTNGSTYYYIVTAVNSAGESVRSSEVSATASPVVNSSKKAALLVPNKLALETSEAEMLKIMRAGAPVDVVDATDVRNGVVNLNNYSAIACFTYGSAATVANIDQPVVDAVMAAVSAGSTFVTNNEACSGKVMGLSGYLPAVNYPGYYPALRDSAVFATVPANDPLFSNVRVYSGNPAAQTVSYWDTVDHQALAFRVDNTLSYVGRLGASSAAIIPPSRYLASGFGTGFTVGAIGNTVFPEWNRGAGRIVVANWLTWTFNQATQSGGYFGIAGRQVLKNIANGL